MNLLNLYPGVREGASLLIQPEGGLLSLPQDPTDLGAKRTFLLTPLAVEVVRRCSGDRSVFEILSDITLYARGRGFDATESAAELLADLARRGILAFYDEPWWQPIPATGSSEYFTPVHFSVELTSHCNLRCRHCYRASGPHRDEYLPTRETLSLFDTMASHGVNVVELTGGEPLTHPDFIRLFKKAIEVFGRVGVVTNGTLVSEEIASLFGETSHKLLVQIDLDGDRPEVHDSFRGVPGSFAQVCQAAHTLRKHRVFFRVAMNVHAGNIDRIRQTVELARHLGASLCTPSPILPVGRAVGLPVLDPAQTQEYLQLVMELESSQPDFVKVKTEAPIGRRQNRENCGAGSRSLVLGPSGGVRPCLMLGEEHGSFGNLFEQDYQTLMMRAPLAAHYSLQAPSKSFCQECDHLYSCKGCHTRPFHVRADYLAKGTALRCAWGEKTGYFELMDRLSSQE